MRIKYKLPFPLTDYYQDLLFLGHVFSCHKNSEILKLVRLKDTRILEAYFFLSIRIEGIGLISLGLVQNRVSASTYSKFYLLN